MKVRIEFDDSLDQVEVVIRTSQLGPEIEQIQRALQQVSRPSLVFYKGSSEYFLSLGDILFFETDGTKIYAHTADDAYEVKMKLYELEEYLPIYFCRVSKSTIANSKAVYSLDKSFSGTSRISFYQTHKEVHVSRHYYHLLKEKLREVR
ncbi:MULTISPECIES: LytTR family DNA-binding domain-containing protein [Streptococcus]|uniref:LytTR family DNA-binding domain-containing protein n=1 Tax=Streptococcus TaxID=1301 RepID=UPI000428BEDB|nr:MULTISPECIES: LytTR family DNA-binding domain-containing protein [Streptococcus]AUC92614.1 LytTR family transcriptional regulator [Streptococcus suis]MCL4934808.1 LytTR family transcriptional regulator [Streptococcus suis]MDG4507904.1 LytTR family transcriptional regulator [Streptococcus suis]